MSALVPQTRAPVESVSIEGRHRWVRLLTEAADLARAIADTDFVPRSLRRNEAAITAAIMYGDEVGLPPMQALSKIAVIDGRPSMAAEAQRALILAAGHFIWFEDFTKSKVTWAGKRRDAPVEQTVRITWTLDNARDARIIGKDNWKRYPRAMLSARASAELARAIFADVIGGLAATEELDDGFEPETVEPGEAAEAAPKTSSRRRRDTGRVTPVVSPTPPSEPQDEPELPLPEDSPTESNQPSDAQTRKMYALLNSRGIRERGDKLLFVNKLIEREVQTSAELTADEVSTLIDALDAMPAVEA
jgi:hypothetical protein